ncbi:MAG: amino acid permease [Chitinophagaceae bacterium]
MLNTIKFFRKKSIEHLLLQSEAQNHGLKRILSIKDLTFFGIAAVIGAGIFSTIGKAAFHGGPSIALLFVFTAFTCGLASLCYAEFASRVPVAGSAYTYSYVVFGELTAWVIGWCLVLEYLISNVVIAISWSSYMNNILQNIGIHLPAWLLTNPFQAQGIEAPYILGIPIIMNLPAFLIVLLVTGIAYMGIKESVKANNIMVYFKLLIILFVIAIGIFYINVDNWIPFFPNGVTGMFASVSSVFFAYIGFDAISTTAEETKDPQRNLPRGMIYALLICTVIYVLVALVLTGIVYYADLDVDDPLALLFKTVNQPKVAFFISFGAVVASTSALLVYQMAQPRIWMNMSRDGLLPKPFKKIHRKYKTPSFGVIVAGFIVAIFSLFTPSDIMTDITSIGTLFAFVFVCFGILFLPKQKNNKKSLFRVPYINGRYIGVIAYFIYLYVKKNNITTFFTKIPFAPLSEYLLMIHILIVTIIIYFTVRRKWSFIPVLGGLCCQYLMTEISVFGWKLFLLWMALGLLIYFLYGQRKSLLRIKK